MNSSSAVGGGGGVGSVLGVNTVRFIGTRSLRLNSVIHRARAVPGLLL